jgi:hypothetical protein
LSEARESAAAQGLFASASAQINCGIIRAAGSKDPQGLLIGRSRSCRSCIGDRSPPGACRQCGAAPTAAPTPLGRVVCSHPLNVAGPDRPRKVVCGKLPVRPWTAG